MVPSSFSVVGTTSASTLSLFGHEAGHLMSPLGATRSGSRIRGAVKVQSVRRRTKMIKLHNETMNEEEIY